MDMKFDSMIIKNQEESERKTNLAIKTINMFLEEGQRISVTTLVKRTGLSRGFFYKNDKVRTALDDAVRRQGACYNPRQVIMDRATEEKMINLKLELTKTKGKLERALEENCKLDEENQLLQQEHERMKTDIKKLKDKLAQKEMELLTSI